MALGLTGGDCDGGTCAVAPGGAFALSVVIVAAPAEGYIGIQSFIDFGSDLIYKPADEAKDEVAWLDCDTDTIVRFHFPQTIDHACATGLLPPLLESSYEGTFVELSFNCSSTNSSTLVKLMPLGDLEAESSGAGFVLNSGPKVAAKVNNLTVNCGNPAATTAPSTTSTPTRTQTPTATNTPVPTMTSMPDATPEPTRTPSSTPTSTPTPPATSSPAPSPTATPTPVPASLGDVSCDGAIDPVDAALLLQFVAALLGSLDCLEAADVNGDGSVNALDATLILQFSAGLISQLSPAAGA